MSDYDLQHDSIASLEATCLASMPRKMHMHAYCWLSLDLEKTSDYRNVKRNNIYLIYAYYYTRLYYAWLKDNRASYVMIRQTVFPSDYNYVSFGERRFWKDVFDDISASYHIAMRHGHPSLCSLARDER